MHIASICRRSFPLVFPLSVLAAFGAPALATEAAWLGTADCRIASLKPAPSGVVSWTGACVDGYASGKGVLAWNAPGLDKVTLEATLVRGEVSGEAKMTTRAGVYIGTLRQGIPHGQGYFEYANQGGWYEGAIVDGKYEGAGIYLS
ncbi:MAG: hypothetical protein ABWY02_05960, partial [Telluria sp.]